MSDTDVSAANLPPTQPPSIQRAYWATLIWVGLSVLSSVDLWLHKDYLRRSILDNNAKAKKKQDLSTQAKLDHSVNLTVVVGLVQMLIVGGLIVIVAMQLRRGRPWARWALLILAVIPVFGIGVLIQLINGLTGDAPGDFRIVFVLGGLAALALIVLLLLPESSRYYATLRGRSAAPAAARGAGGLFGALLTPRRRGPAVEEVVDDSEFDPPGKVIEADEAPPVSPPSKPSRPPARPRGGAKPKTATGTPRGKSKR